VRALGWIGRSVLIGALISVLSQGAAWAQCTAAADSAVTPVRLYMPDGQLISSPVRVFVDKDLPSFDPAKAGAPELRLFGGHAVTPETPGDRATYKPLEVIPHQSWEESANGQTRMLCGTILLFDLSHSGLVEWWKPMRRVQPVLSWSGGQVQKATLPSPINLGNGPAAWGWTILLMLIVAVLIAWLAGPVQRRLRPWMLGVWNAVRHPSTPKPSIVPGGTLPVVEAGAPFCLLCADDGHLSLSKVQVAAWTVAIAAVVFYYGLIRIEVPSIPEQLVALLGFSLATGAISYLAPPPVSTAPTTGGVGGQPPPAQPAAGAASDGKVKNVPRLSDLLRNFPDPGPPQLSVARAQMVVWTILVLILFVAKSALEGTLWAVPWQLVALTGISQAGYLGPKFYGPGAKQQSKDGEPKDGQTTGGQSAGASKVDPHGAAPT
jgi:hypothetical protein